jgi:hypothetical protein
VLSERGRRREGLEATGEGTSGVSEDSAVSDTVSAGRQAAVQDERGGREGWGRWYRESELCHS